MAMLVKVTSKRLATFPKHVLDALGVGPGLFDRLIADHYSRAGLETLTPDCRMTSLPNAGFL